MALDKDKRKEAVDFTERKLWDLICAGGGNGETIRAMARSIVRGLETRMK